MDKRGCFLLSDDEVMQLRAIWHAPSDHELMLKVKGQMNEKLMGILRSCSMEQVGLVRAQLDVLDYFFSVMDDTVDTNLEKRIFGGQIPHEVPPAI